MGNRGRGFMSGGVWDGEYDSETLINLEKRLATLEQDNEDNAGTSTLTGVPQCATPFLIASRVDTDGLVYVTLRFTSIASLLRRFWPTIRKIKRDGTYGKERRHPGYKVSPAQIAANSVEMEWFEGLPPNFTWDCVLIEAKLTDASSDDGGSHDQDPDPYVSKPAPDGTQLGRFVTGAGQAGNQVLNFCQNAKLKWDSASWVNINAGGTGIDHDNSPPLGANDCAKWRYALNNNSGLNTTAANGNYWRKTGAFPGTLNLQSSNSAFDPCNRIQGKQFDPGEPFCCGFNGILNGQFSALDLTASLTATLVDDGLPAGSQVVATSTFPSIAASMSRSEWRYMQMPPTTCASSWVPTGRQWVRWHLDTTLSSGRSIIGDKFYISTMQGAFAPNINDLAQTADPTAASPSAADGRGTSGYGAQSGNFPTGTGGAYRPYTD